MEFDVLVLGSGVAGLSAVVRLATPAGLRVGVLTKADLSQWSDALGSGGIAAAVGGDEDSTDLHLADTLAAGAGLCDVSAVGARGRGAASCRRPIALGAVFDREAGGDLALAREGGHSTARVLHAEGRGHRGRGGAGTRLRRAAQRRRQVLEPWFAVDLVLRAAGASASRRSIPAAPCERSAPPRWCWPRGERDSSMR